MSKTGHHTAKSSWQTKLPVLPYNVQSGSRSPSMQKSKLPSCGKLAFIKQNDILTLPTVRRPLDFGEHGDGTATRFAHELFPVSAKWIMFYFSASWCGPCQFFTPKLIEYYAWVKARLGEKASDFEIVFVSSDEPGDSLMSDFDGNLVISKNDPRSYYHSKMPWPMLEEESEDWVNGKHFLVRSIPSLIIYDVLKEEAIAFNGVDLVNSDLQGEHFPYVEFQESPETEATNGGEESSKGLVSV